MEVKLKKGKSLHGAKINIIWTAGERQLCSGLCNGSVKSTGKLYQQREVYRKNETVRVECELDRETEAHHISEQGWKESARQQSVKNISSGYQ